MPLNTEGKHKGRISSRRLTIRGSALTGALATVATLLALSRTAQAGPTDAPVISFCGPTLDSGPPPAFVGTRENSVWQAFRNYVNSSIHPTRNCFFCHFRGSVPGNLELAVYIQSAFEIDFLFDWVKTSYWAPGFSKTYASWKRMETGTMPPGRWPDSMILDGGGVDAGPSFNTLRERIKAWEARWDDCEPLGFPDGFACVWGQAIDPNQVKCNW